MFPQRFNPGGFCGPRGPRPGGFQFSRHVSIRGGGCNPCLPAPCPPPFPPVQINNFGGCPPYPQPYPVPVPQPYPVLQPFPVMPPPIPPQTIVQPVVVQQQAQQAVAANQGSFVNEFNPTLNMPPLPPLPPAPAPKKKNALKYGAIALLAFLGIKHLNNQQTDISKETHEEIITEENDDIPEVPGGGGAPTGADEEIS